MAIIRAMAVLRHVSGLAKHNAVNTFHFSGNAADAGVRAMIQAAIYDFYLTDAPAGGSTAPLARYLSSSFPTLDIFQYEIPGTLEPDGRETPAGPPIQSFLGTPDNLAGVAGGRLSPTNLPQEVAVCVSFQGTPGAGMVQRRRRGRIYVGPLNDAANDGALAGSRPSLGLRTCLGEQFQRLLAVAEPTAPFVVYSRPFPGREAIPRVDRPDLPALPARAATTVNVTQAWVDDEFDTQRRRGLTRTGRTILTTA